MSSLDIIVPCYRYGRYLRECVTSLLTQSFRNIRVVIINDASPDRTADVASDLLRQDSRVSYIEHSKNKGHIYTYNEGIEWVSADYLLLLSADDYVLPGALQRAVTLMELHPEVGLAFGNAFEIDEQGRQTVTNCVPCRDIDRVLSGLEFILLSGARNIVPTPTAVVRTALQKKVGGYRAELPHAADMELWFRLAANSSVGFITVPQAVYRRHASNMSLSYAGQSYLLDFTQRKAALNCFFESCHALLPKYGQVRRRMFSSLAIDAVACASTAFNNGNSALMSELLTFALETSSSAKFSPAWVKLASKRIVGLKAWQMLSSGRLERATNGCHDPRDTVSESTQ
ncbi:MAG: glycosyltransferase [Candidatus Sulfotelmatobacter sp.]|jgi:glycosyltransferase involved in cell wall biosynthesis